MNRSICAGGGNLWRRRGDEYRGTVELAEIAARTDVEHYETERQREIGETEQIPEREKAEVAKIFQEYGLSETELKPVVEMSDLLAFLARSTQVNQKVTLTILRDGNSKRWT
jgi:hypothetical protein